MDEYLRCPACYASIPADSSFCKSCGRSVRRCPKCGALLLEGVMFCSACQASLPEEHDGEGAAPGQGEETPYLVWEGFPFSWMQRTTQTKRQWQITAAFIMAFTVFSIIVFLFVLNPDLPEEDIPCLASMAVVGVIAVVFGLWVRFWVGRSGAESQEHQKRE